MEFRSIGEIKPGIDTGLSEHQKALQEEEIKDSRYSLGKTAGIVFKQSIPFLSPLFHQDTFSMNYSKEPINFNSNEVKELMNQVPEQYWRGLLKSRNIDQLKADINGIKLGLKESAYMTEQHGLGASLLMYGVAGFADPLTYAGGLGITKRIEAARQMYQNASNAKKAIYAGTTAAGVNAAEEVVIQSTREQDDSAVGVAAIFGLAFGSGASMAHSLINNVHINDRNKAIHELTTSMPDTTTKQGRERAQELLDVVNAESSGYAVTSRLQDIAHVLTGGNWKLVKSPTYMAWKKGGDISAIGRQYDVQPGLTKLDDGTIVKQEAKNAMDHRYDISKDFLDFEIARINALKASGMDEMTFTRSAWEETQKLRQEYESEINTQQAVIMQDSNTVNKLKQQAETNVVERLKKTEEFKGLSDKIAKAENNLAKSQEKLSELQEKYAEKDILSRQEKANLTKLKNKIEANKQTIETESKQLELETRNKAGKEYIDREFESLLRREAIGKARDIEINTGNKGLDEIITASSKYYEGMHKRLVDAGIDGADDMLPKFYSPIVYDTAAIKTHKEEEVIESFKMAIEQSDAYKKALAEAHAKLDEVNSKLSKTEVKQSEEINRLLKEAEYAKSTLENLKKLDSEDIAFADMSGSMQKPFTGYKRTSSTNLYDMIDKNIDSIVDSSPEIKELMRLSGLTTHEIRDLFDKHAGEYIGQSSVVRINMSQIGDLRYKANKENFRNVLRHELIHAISTNGINTNLEYAKAIRGIYEMFSGNSDIKNKVRELALAEARADIPANRKDVFDANIKHNIEYMLGNIHDFVAVGVSNKYIAKALNQIEYSSGTGPKFTIFGRLISAVKKAFGISNLKKGSVLHKILSEMENHSKPSKASIETHKATLEASNIQRQLDELVAKSDGSESSFKKQVELKNKLDSINAKILKSYEDSIVKINKVIDGKNKEIQAQKNALSNAEKNLVSIEEYPAKAAKRIVKKIKDPKNSNIAGLDFDNIIPSRLKGRTLKIDVTNSNLDDYVIKNEAALSQMYNYTMGGRISNKLATGFDKTDDYMSYLKENFNLDKEDTELAKDMFELSLGTRQLPKDPDEFWQKSTRMMTHFNYITMGGQFGRTALSEIGAGVYRTGFGYFKELFPALGNVTKMYQGKDLDNLGNDTVSLVEASSIYQNKSMSAFADDTFIESSLAQGVEKGLKYLSTKMFRWSGLEGITTMTQIALPRAFLRRIIKEADNPTAKLDMLRWGIDINDMKAIKEQPYKMDESGVIVDFNFSKWNPEVLDKFKTVTMRMSRDAIMRPDAVRVPSWMNNGMSHWIVKLTRQFMTFTFLSNERLMMAGLGENKAMALTGTVISAAILYGIEQAAENTAVALGIIDEKDRKYSGEDGQKKLAQWVMSRHSFSGLPGMTAETISNLASGYGEEDLISKMAGGPTAGRVIQYGKAVGDAISGKQGTRSQINAIKSTMPFQNLVGLDTFNKKLANDIIEEYKREGYHE